MKEQYLSIGEPNQARWYAARICQMYQRTTEKQFREQIRDLCKITGWKFYFTWTSIHSPRGMPDLILCRPPRVIFAELKTEKGELSDKQKEWVEALSDCKGNVECYVWRPSQIEEIADILRDT